MNQAEAIEKISNALAHFTVQIAQENIAGFYSKNRLLEDLVCPAFAIILQAPTLHNLNSRGQNNAFLDLGDDKAKIGIQVTREDRADKITTTLEGVLKSRLYDKYSRIVIFILRPEHPRFTKKTKDGWAAIYGAKLGFIPERDIISLPQLLSLIAARPTAEIFKIEELFARSIMGGSRLHTVEIDPLTSPDKSLGCTIFARCKLALDFKHSALSYPRLARNSKEAAVDSLRKAHLFDRTRICDQDIISLPDMAWQGEPDREAVHC